MLQKKVCVIGAFAVGKTSLVFRFVQGIFSAKYLTTVGVKIDKKVLTVDDDELTLVVWDLAGASEFQPFQANHLRGASGLIVVIDGTRKSTVDTAVELLQLSDAQIGPVPAVGLLNKMDLSQEWAVDEGDLDKIPESRLPLLNTSAKTGEGVEDAFRLLATRLLAKA